MASLPCPSCQQPLVISAEMRGQRVKCPHCQSVLSIPAKARWYLAHDGQSRGPFSRDQLIQLRDKGILTPESLLLKEGTQQWLAASTIEKLFTSIEPPPKVKTAPLPPRDVREPLRIELPRGRSRWPLFAAAFLLPIAFGAVWFWPRSTPPETPPIAKGDPKPAPPGIKPPDAQPPIEDPPNNPKPPEPKVEVPPALKEQAELAERFVARLNEFRRAAGIGGVSLSPQLTRGCQSHARYLGSNPKLPLASVGDEDPSLPGFSQEGREAAGKSIIYFVEPTQAIELWMARLFSRIPLLDPQLRQIGLGIVHSSARGWITVLDPVRGKGDEPIAYPADGQRDVPLYFAGGSELPGATGKQVAGFPITLTFSPRAIVTKAVAQVLQGTEEINFYFSAPDEPNQNKQQRNTVAIIPRAPLQPRALYQVTVEAVVDGQDFQKSWSFTSMDDGDSEGAWARQALDRFNDIRRRAGLPPVQLSDALSQGCQNHARYLVLNIDHPATQGLGAHDEDPKLPGYTPDGAAAGKAGDIALGDADPLRSIDGWMATFYHRIPMLDPRLKTVGFGCALGPRQSWISVLDIGSGKQPAPQNDEILYPVPDQTGVPLAFPSGGEIPDPIPLDQDGKASFPITLTFPPGKIPESLTGKLFDGQDREVEIWFSSPTQPANPKYPRHQGTTVCLIGKDPLLPDTRYRVEIAGQRGGAPWSKTWSFRTGTSSEASETIARQIVERISQYRQQVGLNPVTLEVDASKGCELHTQYLVRNRVRFGQAGFNPNDEEEDKPGFTAEGKAAARRSDILFGVPRPIFHIERMMGSVIRRAFLLDPALRRVGFGSTLDVGRGWISMMDLNTGRGEEPAVLCPAPGQEKIPTRGEDTQVGAGFPITITFAPGQKVTRVEASLADIRGKKVDLLLSTPEAPLEPGKQRNTICLHPRQALAPNAIYQVSISAQVNGRPWQESYRFSTAE